jgi:hypothetical protein
MNLLSHCAGDITARCIVAETRRLGGNGLALIRPRPLAFYGSGHIPCQAQCISPDHKSGSTLQNEPDLLERPVIS